MSTLEDLVVGTKVKGIVGDEAVTLIATKWCGSNAVEVVYKDSNENLGSQILYRDREPELELETLIASVLLICVIHTWRSIRLPWNHCLIRFLQCIRKCSPGFHSVISWRMIQELVKPS